MMLLAREVLTVTRQMKSTALKSAAFLLALNCPVALSARAADAQEPPQQATTNAPPADAVPPSYPPPASPSNPPPAAPSDAPAILPLFYAPMPLAYAAMPPPVYAPSPRLVAGVDAADLARRGRQKEIVGVVLMVVGAVATVGGIAMSLDALINDSIHCSGHEEHATCTGTGVSELGAGELMLAGGQLAMLAGIPVYVVGRVQSENARRPIGHVGLQPLVGASGAGVMASAHIRL